MSQEQKYDNNNAWIDNGIRDRTIQCYSEGEYSIDYRCIVGRGKYGVTFEARVKETGQKITLKTSFPDQYGSYKRFVKEVTVACLYCVFVTVERVYFGHVTKIYRHCYN